uniref:Putative aminopeptidase n=1 Tax=Amblyomma aureolatum TaxID=187763 RepID=A0A1E1X963_9ACAR
MAQSAHILFPVSVAEGSEGAGHDSVVIVGTGLNAEHLQGGILDKYREPLLAYKEVDAKAEEEVFVLRLSDSYAIKRLVYSPTGPFSRDFDDVRVFADAAYKGIKRALAAGSAKPLVVLPTQHGQFDGCNLATVLGIFQALYVPLEIREDIPTRQQKVLQLGFGILPAAKLSFDKTLLVAQAIELGRIVCRDIGGSDPERMAAPRVADYVEQVFRDSPVKVQVIADETSIQSNYPLLAAVNRAARGVARHQCRMIHLTYEPEGPVSKTLFLVGKGVTYDTGGADVKAGGHMAGMHRDKCGAAAVAGFFQVLCKLRPKNIKVYGAMAMVRNSIGSECYVSDEIITSRAGVRVRIGNTDAEGRMAMADALCEYKEKALGEVNPRIFTIATLTGHACMAVGEGYSIIIDNGPSRSNAVSKVMQSAGDKIGDLFEVSPLRREDYDFVRGPSEYEDVLQCNNEPSSRTPRGHQMPAAFLVKVSGLDKHGLDSARPLCYSHIDIAASSGPYPGVPSGAPIAALTQAFLPV